MRLRDEVEYVLRAWHAHETGRGNTGIIDYDCGPAGPAVPPATDRLAVLHRLTDLYRRATADGDTAVADRVRADVAYLHAVLGQRPPVRDYLRDTQGCTAVGPTDEQLDSRRGVALAALERVGVAWGPTIDDDLRELEGPLPAADAAEAIRAAADVLEPAVRDLTGSTAPYTLSVQSVDVDAYWGYWLDGVGPDARLRLNLRRARFTEVRARQFALHEVLGHALQSASYAHRAATGQVPWVRILSVHTPYQVMLEGLAQAMPLFVTPGDLLMVARVRLAHYLQLVNARLHLAVNDGTPVAECAAEALALVPHWSTADVADALADRGADPLLRSYLWAYPAGIDWFADLADTADPGTVRAVLHAAYRDPLTPADLARVLAAVSPADRPARERR